MLFICVIINSDMRISIKQITMEIIIEKLEEIKNIIISQTSSRKEILSLSEAAEFLHQSKSSVYKLTSKKEIPHYSPGGKKIYFRKSELEEWVYNSRIDSVHEVQGQSQSYLSRGKKSKL